MIGDMIISIRKWWKQLICVHEYKNVYMIGTGGDYDLCTKCGRTKH